MSAAISMRMTAWDAASQLAEEDLARLPRFPARRRRANEPQIDWQRGETLFVFGYETTTRSGKNPSWRWPSDREIARELRCNLRTVQVYAASHNWLQRRVEFMRWAIETRSSQGAIPPTTSTPAASSEPVTGSPAPLERTPKEPLSIIEAYIVRFADNLEAGKVKLDDVAQFDKAVRLRAYLRGEGERDANKPQALTLDQLQGEHHARRAAERGADADDELAGVHAAGSDALEDDAPAPVQGAHVGTTTDSTRKRSSKGKKGKQKQEVAAALESKKPETKAPFSIDTNDEPDPLALDDEPVPPSQ